jgi:hypothetical protein
MTQLAFDENTIEAHDREIVDVKRAAVLQSQSLQSIISLHTELQEQEQVLTMFAKQRDEAIALKNQHNISLKSLREEGLKLRHFIDSHKAVTIEKGKLISRAKILEEIHDVCRSLSAWKLTKLLPTRVELVYEHQNKTSHIIDVEFAAKTPAIVCALKYSTNFHGSTNGASKAKSDSNFFSRLIASLNPVWSNMVESVDTLQELQSVMQSIDVEMGRLQALDQDLSAVSKRFVIPKGIDVPINDNDGAKDDMHTTTVCRFTVHFSCLEPASKWNVGFVVLRGYPFGRVNIVPETEFGNSPTNVADICDVAFGYTRLERACEHLQKIFLDSCV